MNTNPPTVVILHKNQGREAEHSRFAQKVMVAGSLFGISLLAQGCVINTNVAVTKDSVVVQNNVSVSEKLLKLFLFL